MNIHSSRRRRVGLKINGIAAMSTPSRLAVVAAVAVTIAAATGVVVAQQRGAEVGGQKAGMPATAPAESEDARVRCGRIWRRT